MDKPKKLKRRDRSIADCGYNVGISDTKIIRINNK